MLKVMNATNNQNTQPAFSPPQAIGRLTPPGNKGGHKNGHEHGTWPISSTVDAGRDPPAVPCPSRATVLRPSPPRSARGSRPCLAIVHRGDGKT